MAEVNSWLKTEDGGGAQFARQREQLVQRPSGRKRRGMFEEKKGDQCGWNRGGVRHEGERVPRIKHAERALYPTVRCVGFKSEEMNYIFRSEEMRL